MPLTVRAELLLFAEPTRGLNRKRLLACAGCNAYLLSREPQRSFGLYRQQCDFIWSLGEVGPDGIFRIPARHSDGGWCDFREPKDIAGFDRNLILVRSSSFIGSCRVAAQSARIMSVDIEPHRLM